LCQPRKAKSSVDLYKEKYPLLFSEVDIEKDEQLIERYEEAWQAVRKAATLLKRRYGAKKVLVFGSLIDRSRFNYWSDVDLAVVGIADGEFYAAVGAVTSLITKFEVDLVDLKDCKLSLRKVIESEGVEI